MCITKTESWGYDGKLYSTEAEAVNAALKNIGDKIISQFSAHPHEGLLAFRDELLELLPKAQHEKGAGTAPPKTQKGPESGEAEGTRPQWTPDRFNERGDKVTLFRDINSLNEGVVLSTGKRCAREEDHDWHTDPNSHGLVDYCLKCGEGRA